MEPERHGKADTGSGAPLRVVANGVDTDHGQFASPANIPSGDALKVSGPVAGAGDLEATVQEYARIAGAACWECRLTLRNTGTTPILVTRADAFVGRLTGSWSGLAFTSKWGEEWEPEEFAVSGPREFDVRSGRSSMSRTRGWD